MKVLKSGIEMKSADLKKIRGGSCACGCGITWDGDTLNVTGDYGGVCFCGCDPGNPGDLINGNSLGAQKYLIRP